MPTGNRLLPGNDLEWVTLFIEESNTPKEPELAAAYQDPIQEAGAAILALTESQAD